MLFDDNLGFISYNFITNKPTDSKKLTDLEEGFFKGNSFASTYKPYKHYKYAELKPKTKEEELRYEVMMLTFAIIDLGLYLDLHPNDEEMLKKFRMIAEKSCQKEMEYVKNYGPLELIDNDYKNRFTWIQNPWPWENTGGAKYV